MKERRVFLVSLAIIVITLALYWPATNYHFLTYDEDEYVYNNPFVTGGLSWEALKWAFTSGYAANWHPITWISHMIDWSLFGRFAGGHHMVNVILHAINSVLVFLVLKRMTKAFWPSALHGTHCG